MKRNEAGGARLAERIIKSPILILIAIALGILTGVFFKGVATRVAFVGAVYLDMLKMTTYPILITAIITSVGRLFSHPHVGVYLGRLLIVFLVALLICALLAAAVGLAIQPGRGLSKESQITLGETLSEADRGGEQFVTEKQSLPSFLAQLIPENIFRSMGEGASLQILFFCLTLGVAVGILKPESREQVLGLTESLFEAFFIIIDWILYLLPIGLFSLLAGQIAKTGVETMFAMTKFVIVVYVSCLAFFALSAVTISLTARVRILEAVGALKESLLIAFGTQSSFASMPAAINGLTGDALKVDHSTVNLVMPIAIIITRFSMIIVYVAATLFAAQLYGIQLGLGGLVLTVLLSLLAAVAGAGTPGIIAIAMISIIFTPLGLPSSAMIVLLLAINPVIEPVTTLTNVYANCAATVLIAKVEVPLEDSNP